MLGVMQRGGFRTVELSLVGWAVLLGVGGGVGGSLAGAAVEPRLRTLLLGGVLGAMAAYAAARLVDEIRRRRALINIAVRQADDAVDRLHEAGIRATGQVHVDADRPKLEYVTVYAPSAQQARLLVGLPRTGRRAGRRAHHADRRVWQLLKARPS